MAEQYMGTNSLGSHIALITNILYRLLKYLLSTQLSRLNICPLMYALIYESCFLASIIPTDRNSYFELEKEKNEGENAIIKIYLSTNKRRKGYRKAYYFVSREKSAKFLHAENKFRRGFLKLTHPTIDCRLHVGQFCPLLSAQIS